MARVYLAMCIASIRRFEMYHNQIVQCQLIDRLADELGIERPKGGVEWLRPLGAARA